MRFPRIQCLMKRRKVEGTGRGDVFKGREKWFEGIWRDKMPLQTPNFKFHLY